MINILEFRDILDTWFPPSLSLDWDHDGMQCCPSVSHSVSRVLCCLDVTRDVLSFASQHGFDTVISHHPFLFRPIDRISAAGARPDIVDCIRNDIAVFSYHTRLDAVAGGVADCLAEACGLSQCDTVSGTDGILRIGNTEIQSLPRFCTSVKNALGSPFVLFASAGRNVTRVAVCPGDGKDFVAAAAEAGADTYLAGRLSYNTTADAEKAGINLIEAGHFFTEWPVVPSLTKRIQAELGLYCESFYSLNIQTV